VKFKVNCGLLLAIFLMVSTGWADSLELKNGSLIKGKFIGGTETEITFQVGSSRQKYSVEDMVSVTFDSEKAERDIPRRPERLSSDEARNVEDANREAAATVTIPAGTRISVRTIDRIDSTKNQVGDRFQASLEEPIFVDGVEVASQGADVYGRLTQSKTTGTFTGKSQLGLELTGIVVMGQTLPIVTGEYEVSGKSRGASTAKRTVGGAAVGTIIGALAGGGKGAAIGAGVGAGAGAGSEVITRGDQVKVPSETLLDFTLQQDVSVPARNRQLQQDK